MNTHLVGSERRSSFASLAAVLVFLIGSATGCDSSTPETVVVTQGVYVANQGNFSDANGSITVYDPSAKATTTMVTDAGSTIQSLAISGDSLFVMLNSGGRVDVYSLSTGARTGQISGLASPRYIAVTPARVAYVSNLFKSGFTGGSVSVVDLALDTVIATTEVGDNPEGVVIAGNKLYVANSKFGEGTTLSVISLSTNAVTQTIDIGCDGPRSVLRDREDELWVVCTGKTEFDADFNVVAQTPGEVIIVDGPTGSIVRRITLAGQVSTAGPGQDAYYSEAEQELYVVVGGQLVLRFNTGANALAETLGPFAGDPIGAVAYDATNRQIFLGRVPNFTSSGYVTIHDRAGQQTESFPAGVAPSHIEIYTIDQ